MGLFLRLAADLRDIRRSGGGDLDRLVIRDLDDDLLELGLEDLARQHALLEPALDLSELAARVGEALRERFGHQAVFGRGDAQIDGVLIGLGQEVDALDANLLLIEVRIETGTLHGVAEAVAHPDREGL